MPANTCHISVLMNSTTLNSSSSGIARGEQVDRRRELLADAPAGEAQDRRHAVGDPHVEHEQQREVAGARPPRRWSSGRRSAAAARRSPRTRPARAAPTSSGSASAGRPRRRLTIATAAPSAANAPTSTSALAHSGQSRLPASTTSAIRTNAEDRRRAGPDVLARGPVLDEHRKPGATEAALITAASIRGGADEVAAATLDRRRARGRRRPAVGPIARPEMISSSSISGRSGRDVAKSG